MEHYIGLSSHVQVVSQPQELHLLLRGAPVGEVGRVGAVPARNLCGGVLVEAPEDTQKDIKPFPDPGCQILES